MLLSFKADEVLAKEIDHAAKLTGLSRSEYLRQAVELQNRYILDKRIKNLSNRLSERHLAENNLYDSSTKDGL